MIENRRRIQTPNPTTIFGRFGRLDWAPPAKHAHIFGPVFGLVFGCFHTRHAYTQSGVNSASQGCMWTQKAQGPRHPTLHWLHYNDLNQCFSLQSNNNKKNSGSWAAVQDRVTRECHGERHSTRVRRRRDAGILKMSFESMSRPWLRFGRRIQDLQYCTYFKIEIQNSHKLSSFQMKYKLKLHRRI